MELRENVTVFLSLEQHYVGLVLSREKEPDKSKVYAFYREKNKDQGMYSEMWLAFVTRVCTVRSALRGDSC